MEVHSKDTVLNVAEKVTETEQWKAKIKEGSKVVVNAKGRHWKAKEATKKLKPKVKTKCISVLPHQKRRLFR